MIRRTHKNIFFLFIAAIIMLACVPTLAPAPTPIPTFDTTLLGTYIAETANAALTQTAMFITPSATPTFTPTPTKTPSETPTPTATFLFLLYSPTASATSASSNAGGNTDYACTVIAQSPVDNAVLNGGAVFSTRWQVKNTGKVAWNSNDIDFRYKSGTKMHSKPAYDLYKNVAVDDMVDLIVDMTAPTNPDVYTTTWKLRVGKNEFCTLTLTIKVQ